MEKEADACDKNGNGVVLALSRLSALVHELPEDVHLLRDLGSLDSKTLNSDEELLHWALLRWTTDSCPEEPTCISKTSMSLSECSRFAFESEENGVVRYTCLSKPSVSSSESSQLGLESEYYSTADSSEAKNVPFAHLMGKWVKYTGSPQEHNGHQLQAGQWCQVKQVEMTKMKVHGEGMGGPFWTSFDHWGTGKFPPSSAFKCPLCQKRGCRTNEDSEFCIFCEEQLSKDWGDDAMQVHITRPIIMPEMDAYKFTITYQFYKGKDARDVMFIKKNIKSVDIASLVEKRRKTKPYSAAALRLSNDREKSHSHKRTTTIAQRTKYRMSQDLGGDVPAWWNSEHPLTNHGYPNGVNGIWYPWMTTVIHAPCVTGAAASPWLTSPAAFPTFPTLSLPSPMIFAPPGLHVQDPHGLPPNLGLTLSSSSALETRATSKPDADDADLDEPEQSIENCRRNSDDKETETLCIICMEESRQWACVPCGHLLVCDQDLCKQAIETTCPMCNGKVDHKIRIHVS